MAVAAAITLNTKVYNPRGTQDGVTTWALVGDSTFGGATSQLTQSLRLNIQGSEGSVNRARVILSAPKARDADTACGCVGTISGVSKASLTVDLASTLTPAERQDFRKRIKDYIDGPVFTALLDSLEPSWG